MIRVRSIIWLLIGAILVLIVLINIYFNYKINRQEIHQDYLEERSKGTIDNKIEDVPLQNIQEKNLEKYEDNVKIKEGDVFLQ